MDTSSDTQITSADAAQKPQPVLGYADHDAPQNVVVWCRLLAIGMLGLGLERVLTMLGYVLSATVGFARTNWGYVGVSSLVFVGWPLLARYLWICAPQLAVRIARGTSSDISSDAEACRRGNELLSVGLMVLGLYQLTEALPYLAIMIQGHSVPFHNLGDLPWIQMSPTMIRLAVGGLLVFANHKIVPYLRRLSDGQRMDQQIQK